jgi:cephalosporin hydroxylase
MTQKDTVEAFHRLFHSSWLDTWANTRWLGVPCEKPPTDLWVYQEIVFELRPDFIIESGTRYGGSAIFLATLCDAVDHGHVVTIDVQSLASAPSCRPIHPRVTYLLGSSTSSETLAEVRSTVAGAATVLVILDSDHAMTHVLDELRLYGELVTPGSYLIVEDTQFNGHPIAPEFGPGPWEAVEVFLKNTTEFAPDYSREKFLLTFNPRGYLRKDSRDGAVGRLAAAAQELTALRRDNEHLRTALGDSVGDLDLLHDELEEERREAVAAVAEAQRQRDEARHLAEEVSQIASQAATEVRAVEDSLSWRLTAPLRRLRRIVAGRGGQAN